MASHPAAGHLQIAFITLRRSSRFTALSRRPVSSAGEVTASDKDKGCAGG